MNNFKRAERDREEYEQKIKELKKIIEMNQTQFSNQLKNINSKHDKAIQELVLSKNFHHPNISQNEQITELKEMNDGLELQAADSAHAVELIAQKDQEIEHLNEEIKKLTQKGKENSQKLKDLEVQNQIHILLSYSLNRMILKISMMIMKNWKQKIET